MEELDFTIKGHSVHYYEWGSKNNYPTIICLHGLGNSGAAFTEMASHLVGDFHIVSFDNPGHGKTLPFRNEADYLFSNLAKWYDKVFQHVLDEPFYILGHSWGADIALHYAKQYPNKIKGIILLDGGFTFPDFQEDIPFSKAYNGWNDYMDNSSVYDTWEDIMKDYRLYTNRWNKKIEKMVLTLFDKSDTYKLIASKFTVLSIIKAFYQESFMTTYPDIKSPLLLIHAMLPKELMNARKRGIHQLKESIKDVTIVSMNDTNHMVHWDNPKMVAEDIHSWVTRE